MKKASIMKLLALILCVVMVAAMAVGMTGCGKKADANVSTETVLKEGEYGQGKVQFTFVAKDIDGNEQTFTINTDKETVGEALLDVNLIAGEDSQYGLYVKTVNGITADYDVDQTYWAFYVDGEYASTGVDSTPVTAGSTYMFAVEK